MNKFEILNCIDVDDDDYKGTAIVLVCKSDPSFMLFFPVSKEQSKLLTYILDDDKKGDLNKNILGIYKTMVDSWEVSDRHLTGIIMDGNYDEKTKEDLMTLRLVVIDQSGDLDSLVSIDFLNAIILAAMEKLPIIVNQKLIDKMIPQEDEDIPQKEKKDAHTFPEDKKIISIAKKIMNGKIKDN